MFNTEQFVLLGILNLFLGSHSLYLNFSNAQSPKKKYREQISIIDLRSCNIEWNYFFYEVNLYFFLTYYIYGLAK